MSAMVSLKSLKFLISIYIFNLILKIKARLGCYYQQAGYQLSCQGVFNNQYMTNQLCAQLCSIKGYSIAATYSR